LDGLNLAEETKKLSVKNMKFIDFRITKQYITQIALIKNLVLINEKTE